MRHKMMGHSIFGGGRAAWLVGLIVLLAPIGCANDSTSTNTPSITRVTPSLAAEVGGTQVEVRTSGFSTSFFTALPAVEFGGQLGTGVTARSSKRVIVDVPSGSGAVDVVLTSADGTESAVLTGGLTYTTAPILMGISPVAGDVAGGELVSIFGDNFDVVGPVTVTLGANSASSVLVQDRFGLTCLTPPGSTGPVTVTVTNPGGEQGSLVNGYTYSSIDLTVIIMEDRVYDLINQERALVGKPALIHDPDMRLVARAHSEDMRDRNFFDHVNPNSLDPFDRLMAAGIPFTAAAENIEWNLNAPDPGQFAVDDWMGSPPHKRNLLDEGNFGYTLTGLGASRNGSGRWWFTQMFVRP